MLGILNWKSCYSRVFGRFTVSRAAAKAVIIEFRGTQNLSLAAVLSRVRVRELVVGRARSSSSGYSSYLTRRGSRSRAAFNVRFLTRTIEKSKQNTDNANFRECWCLILA